MKIEILGHNDEYSSTKFVFILIEKVSFKISLFKGNDSSDGWEEEAIIESCSDIESKYAEVNEADVPKILEALGIMGRPAKMMLEEIPNFIARRSNDWIGSLLYTRSGCGWDPPREEVKISHSRTS